MIKKEKMQIGFDEDGYNNYLAKEEVIFNTYDNLIELAIKAIGDEKLLKDHAELLENPFEYILNIFWDEFCRNEPQHLERELVFKSKSNLTRGQLNSLGDTIKAKIKQMGDYAPKVSKTGITSSLKKDEWNIYLHENKKEEYKIVKQFIDISIELREKYGAVAVLNIVRYHPGILLDNSTPILNTSYFRA